MSIEIYEMKYPEDSILQDAVKAGDLKTIGKHYHDELLALLGDNHIPPQITFALSKSRILVGSVDAHTHEQRHRLSLEVGRAFLQEFREDPIACLVMMTAGVASTADSGVKPNDDPKREYVAVTNILDLAPFHNAKDLDEYLAVHKQWTSKVWFDQHHEGIVIKNVWDGASVIPTDHDDPLDPDDKDTCRFENPNLNQCFIGISGNFAVIRELSKGKSKSDIDAEFAPHFIERGKKDQVPWKTRLRIVAQEMQSQKQPTQLKESIQVEELSDHSVEVLESMGTDAPAILNNYSIELEDLLMHSVQEVVALQKEVRSLQKFKEQTLASLSKVLERKD